MSDHTVSTTTTIPPITRDSTRSHGALDADIIIKNAPDPVFVSDLEGKILSANDAVYELLGFRTDQVLEQSLSRFISPAETREFTAALREVIERGATRNARLNPLYWLLSTSVLKNEKRTAFFDCSLLQLFEGVCVHL
jgi:PAS domain-containing protein